MVGAPRRLLPGEHCIAARTRCRISPRARSPRVLERARQPTGSAPADLVTRVSCGRRVRTADAATHYVPARRDHTGRSRCADAARRRGCTARATGRQRCISSSGTLAGRPRRARSYGSGGDESPHFTLVMLTSRASARCSSAAVWCAGSSPATRGDTFPNFTPNPWFQRAYADGAVEVEHWSFLAFAQRLEAAARGLPAVVTRSIAGCSMEAQRRRIAAPRRRSARSACSRRCSPTWRCSTRRSPTGPATSRSNRRCSKASGARSRHRRGAIVTVERVVDDLAAVVASRPHPGAPGAGRGRGAARRAPGRTVDRCVAGRRLRRGLRVLGRGARRDPQRRLRRLDPRSGSSTWRRRTTTSIGSAPHGSPRCAPRRRPTRGSSTTRSVPARPRRAAERVGARRGRGRARHLADARRRARCRRGARRRGRREPGRVARACRRAREPGAHVHAHRRDRALGLPTRRRPTRSCSTIGTSRPPTMLADATTVLGTLVGGSGTTTIGCLGGAQIDRFGNINSTSLIADGGPFLVGSGGGNDVASTASECIVVAPADAATHAARAAATSPRRAVPCARSSPISGVREARRSLDGKRRARPDGGAGRTGAARGASRRAEGR